MANVNVRINTDLAKLKAEAERLKSNPGTAKELQENPQAFLSRFGIEIDHDTLQKVQSHLAARKNAASAGTAQASAIHIDI